MAQPAFEPQGRATGRAAGSFDTFSESSRRSALAVREIVRGNGDTSSFAFEKGALVRGLRSVPAVLVGSERAIHVIEYHSRRSAVCSYNRVVRFDHALGGEDTVTVGLSLYMGTTPVAERVAAGTGFEPHELANYRLRLPATIALDHLLGTIASHVRAEGVPAHAHAVQPFVS